MKVNLKFLFLFSVLFKHCYLLGLGYSFIRRLGLITGFYLWFNFLLVCLWKSYRIAKKAKFQTSSDGQAVWKSSLRCYAWSFKNKKIKLFLIKFILKRILPKKNFYHIWVHIRCCKYMLLLFSYVCFWTWLFLFFLQCDSFAEIYFFLPFKNFCSVSVFFKILDFFFKFRCLY